MGHMYESGCCLLLRRRLWQRLVVRMMLVLVHIGLSVLLAAAIGSVVVGIQHRLIEAVRRTLEFG